MAICTHKALDDEDVVKPANSAVIWEGPSKLERSTPIVVIVNGLTRPSKNEKTKKVLQTTIMRADMSPFVAAAEGLDRGVCGDCKRRATDPSEFKCYARNRGLAAIWKTYAAGKYPFMDPRDVAEIVARKQMVVRLGTFGDPAAVPKWVWETIVAGAAGILGYTHQWRKRHGQVLAGMAMASVDTPEERAAAKALGMRPFRVRRASDPVEEGEFVCPASHEGGSKTSCSLCKLCGGQSVHAKDPVIIEHEPAGMKRTRDWLRSPESVSLTPTMRQRLEAWVFKGRIKK